MNQAQRPTIGIVGAGRLGASLAAALEASGYTVTGTESSVHRSGRGPGIAQLVFLTVPDAMIASVCASRDWRPGQFIVHCSGALGRETLAAAEARGATTGTFHPLQTFPSRTPEPARFRRIAIGIEGPDALSNTLELLATDLGGHPFRLEGIDRARYHAAAVVASNHLIALASAATRLWALAGLPEHTGRTSLAPLITAAAANVASMELADALTGPIARGDVATVARHLAALQSDPELHELYRRLSLELLQLPLALDASPRAELNTLLKTHNPEDDR